MARPQGTTPTARWPQPRRPSVGQLLGRALRLRCPHCGRGHMFFSWLKMRTRCPYCGLLLERGESDYFIGAYLINLIIAELIVVTLMLVFTVASWPSVPWRFVLWAIIAITIPAVVVTYPFSRSLWLAVDLLFRPAEPQDFHPPGPPPRPME